MSEQVTPPEKRSPSMTVWTGGSDNTQADRAVLVTGTPVALLAGFTLTTAVVLVSQRPDPVDREFWLAGVAAAALLASSTLFLLTLVLGARAASKTLRPDDAMMWHPRARIDAEHFHKVRKIVSNGRVEAIGLLREAEDFWSLGVLAAGVGTGLGLLSYAQDWPLVLAAVMAFVMGVLIATVAPGDPRMAVKRTTQNLWAHCKSWAKRRLARRQMVTEPAGVEPSDAEKRSRPKSMPSPLTEHDLEHLDPNLEALFVAASAAPVIGTPLFAQAVALVALLTTDCTVEGGVIHGVGQVDGTVKTLVELHPGIAGHALVATFHVAALARWQKRQEAEVLAALGKSAVRVEGCVHLAVSDTERLEQVLGLNGDQT